MRVGWSSTLITGISTPPPSFRHLNLKMGKFWAPFTSNRSFESWAACGCIYQLCPCPICVSDRWETICKTERSSFSKSFPVAQLWANHQSRRPWATVFWFLKHRRRWQLGYFLSSHGTELVFKPGRWRNSSHFSQAAQAAWSRRWWAINIGFHQNRQFYFCPVGSSFCGCPGHGHPWARG